MQIPHPSLLVSSAELSPDQQTRHIHRQQVSEGPERIPLAALSPLRIALHSFPFCPSFALKKSLQLWSLLHLAPI